MGNYYNPGQSYIRPLERRTVATKETYNAETDSHHYSLKPRGFPFNRKQCGKDESTDSVFRQNSLCTLLKEKSLISQTLLDNLKILYIANGIASAIPKKLSILNNLNLLTSINSLENMTDEGIEMQNYLENLLEKKAKKVNALENEVIIKPVIPDIKKKENGENKKYTLIEQFLKEESDHTSKTYKNYLINDHVVSRMDKNKNRMKNILIVKRDKNDSEGKSTSPNSNHDSNKVIIKSLKSIKQALINFRNENTQMKSSRDVPYTSQSPSNTKRTVPDKKELFSKSPPKQDVIGKTNQKSFSKTKAQVAMQAPKKGGLKTIVYKPARNCQRTIENTKHKDGHSPPKIPKKEMEYKNVNININELNIINNRTNNIKNKLNVSDYSRDAKNQISNEEYSIEQPQSKFNEQISKLQNLKMKLNQKLEASYPSRILEQNISKNEMKLNPEIHNSRNIHNNTTSAQMNNNRNIESTYRKEYEKSIENPPSHHRNTPVFNCITHGTEHSHRRSNSFGCHYIEFNPNIIESQNGLDGPDAKFSFRPNERDEKERKNNNLNENEVMNTHKEGRSEGEVNNRSIKSRKIYK